MIISLRRVSTAAALALLPLTLATAAQAAPAGTSAPAASPVLAAAPAARAALETVPIAVGVGRLAVVAEDRTGYERDAFRHWNTGLNTTDGCNTRAEVLITEAVQAPAVGARCAL
ncbi:HNH endonuclease, partial [Streptomyces sp. NPDC055078]